MDWQDFETVARWWMQAAPALELPNGSVPGVPMVFDMVPADRSVVGGAKHLSLVQRERLPHAKFIAIAGHISGRGPLVVDTSPAVRNGVPRSVF